LVGKQGGPGLTLRAFFLVTTLLLICIRMTASLLRGEITNLNGATVVNSGFYASFVYTLLWNFVIVVGENEDV